jgi:hypothetical protein
MRTVRSSRTALASISAIGGAMRLHIYPDIGVGSATGFPFRMKAETPDDARLLRTDNMSAEEKL